MADNDFRSIDIEKLIELWQQEECLWNIFLEGYHKKDLKQLRIIRGPFKCCIASAMTIILNGTTISSSSLTKALCICIILAGKSNR